MSEINAKSDSLEEVLKDVLYCSIVDYISLSLAKIGKS